MMTESRDSGISPEQRREPFSVATGAALVLLLCSVLFIWGSWKVPFYERARREGPGRLGDLAPANGLPLRAGTQIPSKPPLLTGSRLASLAAGAFQRVHRPPPSTLLATVGVLLTYLAAARLWGVVAGIASAVVLATSPNGGAHQRARGHDAHVLHAVHLLYFISF
jgi:hypothetical protein